MSRLLSAFREPETRATRQTPQSPSASWLALSTQPWLIARCGQAFGKPPMGLCASLAGISGDPPNSLGRRWLSSRGLARVRVLVHLHDGSRRVVTGAARRMVWSGGATGDFAALMDERVREAMTDP
jgi:hypothetical protein